MLYMVITKLKNLANKTVAAVMAGVILLSFCGAVHADPDETSATSAEQTASTDNTSSEDTSPSAIINDPDATTETT